MSKNKRDRGQRGYHDGDGASRKKSRRDHMNDGASYHQETDYEHHIRQQDGAHHRRVEKFCQGVDY